jgi:hypothetical protein
MPQKLARQEVYALINGERAYQNAKWGPRDDQYMATHERPADFVIYMERYLDAAKSALTDLPESEAQTEALAAIRKVTALGIVCMEVNGAPARQI